MKESNPLFVAAGTIIITLILSILFIYGSFNLLMGMLDLPFRIDIWGAILIRILVSAASK